MNIINDILNILKEVITFLIAYETYLFLRDKRLKSKKKKKGDFLKTLISKNKKY